MRIFVSAGEPSGDLHAANLIHALRRRRPDATFVGFGARALHSGQEPKYLNTPQTPLFDKSGSLYGLDRAGEEARRATRSLCGR